jgi:CheY-like chemotaxis protein
MKSRAIESLMRQIDERTKQLELANRARLRFLAASHDLRQPLHALGLFVAQLRSGDHTLDRAIVVEQIEAAFSILNERFGTVFDMARVDVSDSDHAKPSMTPAPSLEFTSETLVAVIDDDLLVLNSTYGLLRSWGLSVITAGAPGAVVGLINQRRCPDLIISDLRLPRGETGIEVISAIREVCGREIPAVLVSADISSEAMQTARSHGHQLLHKPVEPMTLRAVINRMLKGKASANYHS